MAKEELPTTGIEKAKDMFKDLRKQTLDSLPRGKDYIALVDNEKCIGCTQCVYFCNFASIDMISWDLQARTSQFESKKALILEKTRAFDVRYVRLLVQLKLSLWKVEFRIH